MTPDEVRVRVASINTNDPENAHGSEDDIRRDVLAEIVMDSDADTRSRALAYEALRTELLEFERWYA